MNSSKCEIKQSVSLIAFLSLQHKTFSLSLCLSLNVCVAFVLCVWRERPIGVYDCVLEWTICISIHFEYFFIGLIVILLKCFDDCGF
jgi:hypothetical protein